MRQAFDRAYRDLSRNVNVKGFRPGKAPRSVLESLYGASLREEIERILTLDGRFVDGGIPVATTSPQVVMIVGVNGSGKTTTLGKLAFQQRVAGRNVLLGAGDTFRAAAREQLAQWGARNSVDVIAQQGGDPAAVAFDSVSAARARGVDIDCDA